MTEIKNKNKQTLLNLAKEAKKIQLDINQNCQDMTINEILKEKIYKINSELKTFRQWKKEGKIVKKGEGGYLFFTKPIKVDNRSEEISKEELIGSGYEFFGHCYLFSEEQVN
jgi:predicted metal-dependent hydrolase